MKDDRVYLAHVLECIGRIEEYCGNDRDRFFESSLVQDAVVRNLQTLAESTQRISEPLKYSNSSVDWRAIAGFRNVLTHDYLGIDLERIWGVIERRLPSLRVEVERMLKGKDS